MKFIMELKKNNDKILKNVYLSLLTECRDNGFFKKLFEFELWFVSLMSFYIHIF